MLTGIASVVLTVLAAVYTAFLLPTLQQYLQALAARWIKQREDAETQRAAVNLRYLNPLRLWLEETYVRLREIAVILASSDRCEPLLTVATPEAVSDQPAAWFNEAGAYLISTCYITAGLFFALKQVRENLPYLRLSRLSDTQLMTLMFGVSQGFLQDLGIFYVTQPSIGNDLYLPAQQRLMTYREFCERLQDPRYRVWCDRLIQFYLEVGQRQRPRNVAATLSAIEALSQFLDSQIGAGVSIGDRLAAEDTAASLSQDSSG